MADTVIKAVVRWCYYRVEALNSSWKVPTEESE